MKTGNDVSERGLHHQVAKSFQDTPRSFLTVQQMRESPHSENSDDQIESPVRIGVTMPERAYDAKNTVNQDPGAKEQHKCRGSHNRMSERDYSEDNCSDTP